MHGHTEPLWSQAGVSLHPWNAVPGIAPAEPAWALMPGGQQWAAPWNLHFSLSSSSPVCHTARAAEAKTHLLVLVSCRELPLPNAAPVLMRQIRENLIRQIQQAWSVSNQYFFLGSFTCFFFFLFFPKHTWSVQVPTSSLLVQGISFSGGFADVEVNGSHEATEIFFLLVQIQLQGSRLKPLMSF